jgi:hypothetical protein
MKGPFFAAIGEAVASHAIPSAEFLQTRFYWEQAVAAGRCPRRHVAARQVGDAHGLSGPLHALNVTALPMTKCTGACRRSCPTSAAQRASPFLVDAAASIHVNAAGRARAGTPDTYTFCQ